MRFPARPVDLSVINQRQVTGEPLELKVKAKFLMGSDIPTRRTFLMVIFLAFMVNMAGCVPHIQRSYDGPERPSAEIVTIYNSRRAFTSSIVSIVSADDHRVKATLAGCSVLPGARWYQVWVDRLSTFSLFLLHDVYYTEAVCGFKLDAVPGTVYQLEDVDNGDVVPNKEGKMYKATLKLRQHLAKGATIVLNIPAECASLDLFKLNLVDIPHDLTKGGLLCRNSMDCLKDGAACIIGRDYVYGICTQP